MSHHLQVTLEGGIEGRLVQLNFTAAFDRVSRCYLLYKLSSIGIGGQFFFIVSQFLSDKRQRANLNDKISVSGCGFRDASR